MTLGESKRPTKSATAFTHSSTTNCWPSRLDSHPAITRLTMSGPTSAGHWAPDSRAPSVGRKSKFYRRAVWSNGGTENKQRTASDNANSRKRSCHEYGRRDGQCRFSAKPLSRADIGHVADAPKALCLASQQFPRVDRRRRGRRIQTKKEVAYRRPPDLRMLRHISKAVCHLDFHS